MKLSITIKFKQNTSLPGFVNSKEYERIVKVIGKPIFRGETQWAYKHESDDVVTINTNNKEFILLILMMGLDVVEYNIDDKI